MVEHKGTHEAMLWRSRICQRDLCISYVWGGGVLWVHVGAQMQCRAYAGTPFPDLQVRYADPEPDPEELTTIAITEDDDTIIVGDRVLVRQRGPCFWDVSAEFHPTRAV